MSNYNQIKKCVTYVTNSKFSFGVVFELNETVCNSEHFGGQMDPITKLKLEGTIFQYYLFQKIHSKGVKLQSNGKISYSEHFDGLIDPLTPLQLENFDIVI